MDRCGVPHVDETAQQLSSGLLVRFAPPLQSWGPYLAPPTFLIIGLRALLFTQHLVLAWPLAASL